MGFCIGYRRQFETYITHFYNDAWPILLQAFYWFFTADSRIVFA
jgi:hypothetical protein